MNLLKHFQQSKKTLVAQLTPEQQKRVYQWEQDDAGSDLEAFFDIEDKMDKDLVEKIQFCIQAIKEIEYLEARDKQLTAVETAFGMLAKAFRG